MKGISFLFCLIATLSQTAYAADQEASSLFFTPEEVATIKSEAAKQPTLFALEEKYKLTLQTIVYYAPDDWTVWLQNRAWTPATRDAHLRIERVTPESVTLCATLASGRQTDSVTLHPHETLNLLTGSMGHGSASTDYF